MLANAAVQPAGCDWPVALPSSVRKDDVTLFKSSVRKRPAGGGRLIGRQAQQEFLDALILCGDPALAARPLGLSLVRLLRQRERDAAFARQWQAAIAFAWERVEHRLLAQLLEGSAGFDGKLALAAMARRDQGAARVPTRPVEGEAVARLRAELRALAGPDAEGSAHNA